MSSTRFDTEIGKRVSVRRHYYVIERVIAEGGFGVVFLVRDGHGRKLAMKRMLVNDERRLKDCKNEIELLSNLSGYKGILKYIDSSVSRRVDEVWEIYIVTEYYPDTCMQLLTRKRFMSESEILRIICDLCEAVAILHHCQVSIIHRDVKIENILIDQNGHYVLCDFGSATTENFEKKSIRELEDDFEKHTTKSHRAPEIIDFYSNQRITTKIDIWALGVTLFRLCFNSLPFGESALACQSGHLTIPDSSTYSEALHALLYYIFDIDSESRPDIYQVASVVFCIAGKPNPVKNTNNVKTPSISDVVNLMKIKKNNQIIAKEGVTRLTSARSEWVETTSIRPRERPKAGQRHNLAVNQNGAPVASRSQCSSPYSQLALSADLLNLPADYSVMSRSLDSAQISNPFGDDFSKFDPSQLASSKSSHTPYSNNRSGRQVNSHGFEDAFVTQCNVTSDVRNDGRLPIRHSRHVSDPQVLQATPSSNTDGHLVDLSASLCRDQGHATQIPSPNQGAANFTSSSPIRSSCNSNPFDDDFASYDITDHSKNSNMGFIQPPVKSSYTSRPVSLDQFGSTPFNPFGAH